jgi:hypothetical protein
MITQAAFDAALSQGATRADAEIGANGIVSMTTGPGVGQCATFGASTVKPCRQPNDFVIRCQTAENDTLFVHVPANTAWSPIGRTHVRSCRRISRRLKGGGALPLR